MNTTRDRSAIALAGTLSRRGALRGLGGAGIAAAVGIAAQRRVGADEGDRIAKALFGSDTNAAGMIEPEAGSWKTWILASGDQLRPEAPLDEPATQAELAELQGMAAGRDAVALDRMSNWDAGSPGYRWNELAPQQPLRAQMGPDAYRVLALMNAAIYDATVAAWDAKYAHAARYGLV